MQERKVTVIPATKNALRRMPEMSTRKRRVAGYARVSTDKDEQFTSYEAQVDYYTQFIMSHPDWEFVEVYTDEGISGLGTRNREGFKRMISDALDGRLDLIVTKSVSRFARNTVDSLVTIRTLKEKGVEVYFEKENIYSLDGKGELLLTIMSSLAQEESRSISENVTWGKRKRFSDGKISLAYKNFLGYEHGEKKDDPPVINPEQAVVVRRIYRMFLGGMTPGAIAKSLTADGIPTPAGKEVWHDSTIRSILSNEKYRGSALLQKRFTVDFLTKTMKDNEGEVKQYYIEKSHEPIINPEEWDAVQDEIRRRKTYGAAYSGKSVFGSKLRCEDCGGLYGEKVWHSKDAYRTRIWQCNRKYRDGKEKCLTPHLTEEEIKKRFIAAYNHLAENRQQYVGYCRAARALLTDTRTIDREIEELQRELEIVSGLAKQCVEENSAVALDQEEYEKRYNGYAARYEQAAARLEELDTMRKEKLARAGVMDRFINDLMKRDALLTDFDEHLWLAVVEYATVRRDGSITFRFNDGTEITK